MAEPSTANDSGELRDSSRRRELRNLVTIMVLGGLIGIVFSVFVGTVLWSLGYLTLGESRCPPAEEICPQTTEALPICPTCGVLVVTPTPTATPTQTPTPTPDLLATATAACEAFTGQFPGTPCPPLEATATP